MTDKPHPLDQLHKEIEADLKIDPSNLDYESLRTPEIHHKYLKMMMHEGLKLKKLRGEMAQMRKKLWLFYSGKLPDKEYEGTKFDPNMKILKQDLNMWIEADDRYIELQKKIDYVESKIGLIEGVIRRINSRNFDIRAAIDWRKFCNGQ